MSTVKRIQVTKEVIALSTRADSSHCMIADAIQMAMPEVSSVSVDLATIRYTKDGNRMIYLTPEFCQYQLLRFDRGDQIDPWEFCLPARPTQITANRKWVKNEDGTRSKKRQGGPKKLKKVHPDSGLIQVLGGSPPPLAILTGGNITGRPGMKARRRQWGLRLADRKE